jgi:hypothetical protein
MVVRLKDLLALPALQVLLEPQEQLALVQQEQLALQALLDLLVPQVLQGQPDQPVIVALQVLQGQVQQELLVLKVLPVRQGLLEDRQVRQAQQDHPGQLVAQV